MLDALGMAKPCIPLAVPAYLSSKSLYSVASHDNLSPEGTGILHILEVRGVSKVPINSANCPTSDALFSSLSVTSCVWKVELISILLNILCLFGIHEVPAHQEWSQVTPDYTLQVTQPEELHWFVDIYSIANLH